MIDIAYIVSHGFAARMVTQTNLLGRLVEQGQKVALIAPDKEDENLKKYCNNTGVELFEFNPKSDFWNSNYIKARMYFLENINKNPALYEKYIYAIRYTRHKSFFSWLRPRILKAIHDLKTVFPWIRQWYLNKESRMLESGEASEIINEINPRIIVSTYPVSFMEGMLLRAAKKTGGKTIIHLLSWDNITCKGHFPELADEYIAWGDIMKEELIEYYNVSEENIHICGVPHFDIHIQNRNNSNPAKYLSNLGLNPENPYLFFGMSSPRFAPGEIDIVEWMANQINNHEFGSNLQLVVRPHPQNVQGNMADQTWLPRLEKISNGKVAVDFPDFVPNSKLWLSMRNIDMKRLSILLSNAKACLQSGSTLGIDSLICNVPVIMTMFDGNQKIEYWESAIRLLDYTHLKKFVRLNNVYISKNYTDLDHLIKSINNGGLKLKENNIEVQVSKSGSATNKVVSKLLELCQV